MSRSDISSHDESLVLFSPAWHCRVFTCYSFLLHWLLMQ